MCEIKDLKHITNQSNKKLKINYQLLLLILNTSITLTKLQINFPKPPINSTLLLFPLLSLQKSKINTKHTKQKK